MGDFSGSEKVYLRPGAVKYPLLMVFPPCSSRTANDGAIPYETAITAASVVIINQAGADVTAALLAAPPTIDGNEVALRLTHHPDAVGRCSVLVSLTLDGGVATLPKQWGGLHVL